MRRPVWHHVPPVRSGDQLTTGERAADLLKRIFGTWTILGLVFATIFFWITFINDPGNLHLNLALSCLGAVQGIILQIAANRGDRISSEMAKHNYENGQTLLHLAEATKEQVDHICEEMEAAIASRNEALHDHPESGEGPDV